MAFLDIPTGFTAAQRAAHQVRRSIIDSKDAVVDALKQMNTHLFVLDGVDPQDVFDDFGTNGSKYIDVRDAMVELLDAIATANGQDLDDLIPPAMHNPPEGKVLTVEGDGSITYEDAP